MPRRWRRSITPAFKAQVFLELLSGPRSSAELCREHRPSQSFLAHGLEGHRPERPPFPRPGGATGQLGAGAHGGVGAASQSSSGGVGEPKKASRLPRGTVGKNGRSS